MRTLSVDIETASSVNLAASGVYAYAASPDFEILLFGYSIDHQPPQVVDLKHSQTIPDDVLRALTDPSVVKSAFNATFERVCLSAYLRTHYPGLLSGGFCLRVRGAAQWWRVLTSACPSR